MRNTIPMMLALIIAFSAASAAVIGAPLDVSLLNYVPTPAQPGDLLDVYIQVENTGTTTADGVQIELRGTSELIPQGDTIVSVGAVPAQNEYVAKFRVKVSAEATTGTSLLTIITKQRDQTQQERSVEITIRDDDEAVFISNVRVDPQQIEPGREADLHILVNNLGDTRARDVSVKLDLDGTPFIPVEGTSRQKVDSIGARGMKDFVFTLGVQPSASADIYRVPVEVSFLDSFGDTQTITDTIGLVINTKAQTQAYIDQVSRSDGEVDVTMRIVNRGLSEVKFVEARIADGEDYDIPAQDRIVYVGNIDPDDWETVRFSLTTDAKQITLPIEYTFWDAFNNELTVNQDFTLDIPQAQGQGGISPFIWVVILVVLVGGIYWWRRRKKKQ